MRRAGGCLWCILWAAGCGSDATNEAPLSLDSPNAGDVPRLMAMVSDANEDEGRRRLATAALGRLGEQAGEAAPVLVEESKRVSGPLHREVMATLERIGSAAVSPLSQLAGAAEAELPARLAAVDCLGRMGHEAQGAVPVLGRLLEGDAVPLRIGAAIALGRIGEPAKEAVPALLGAAGCPDSRLRAQALLALGRIGAGGLEGTRVLCRALDDPSAEVRMQAALALARLGDDAVVPALSARLADPSEGVRWYAALALARLGTAAQDALPPLEAAQADQFDVVRGAAVTAVHRIVVKTANSGGSSP